VKILAISTRFSGKKDMDKVMRLLVLSLPSDIVFSVKELIVLLSFKLIEQSFSLFFIL
jgi:hypothetical protein